jgi:hypothetical protein
VYLIEILARDYNVQGGGLPFVENRITWFDSEIQILLEIVAFVKAIKVLRLVGYAGDLKQVKPVDEDIKLKILFAEEAFCD